MNTKQGEGGGAGQSGTLGAQYLCRGKGRKRLTSHTTLRLVAQSGPRPLRRGLVPAEEPECPAQWQLLVSRRRSGTAPARGHLCPGPLQRGLTRATVWGHGPERDV